MANLVRFSDRYLPVSGVQTTCVLCNDPIIRYTPVLGPHAPTAPLYCCRSLVHSACLTIYTPSQAGEHDRKRCPVSSAQFRMRPMTGKRKRHGSTIQTCDPTSTPLLLTGWRQICPRTSAGSRSGRPSVQDVPTILGK